MATLCPVLGKLVIKSIYNYGRPIIQHALPATDFCRHVDDKELKDRIPKPGQEREFYTDLRGKMLGRFAMEEINKKKNAQLQFVKVVRHYRGEFYGCMDFVILDAVDAAGAVKVYQAHVGPDYFTRARSLHFFGLVLQQGHPLKLYDYLGT